MDKNEFKFLVDSSSDVPKFRQLIESVNNAISDKRLNVGDHLPSVNKVCNEYKLSRDTVFKAYTLLKEQGVIQSVPNKGYFIAKEIRRVFLFLDTFKAYKEVLYDSFFKNLPDNVIADVHFHHYNPGVFRKQIEESIGKYAKYVVMPFDHPSMEDSLRLLPEEKLLLIDWKIYDTPTSNVLYQDFGQPINDELKKAMNRIRKYKKLTFVYPEFTNHPYDSVDYFLRFCRKHKINCEVIDDSSHFEIEKGVGYISVSDRILGIFLEQTREKGLEPGEDVGFISYNETPMKKFIYKGITVLSTDFKQMGMKAAEFVAHDAPMRLCIPTHLKLRESF
ncbi:GntR family transcriptional regulator [Marinilabilia rubra]|uniref:GntR family transcriptional regulator n=1 Tax=Marinilabilia rubra TaxID=2162893 RepID=A0A2U2B707_9BACT|nr:GntR family transcriptional regulator [Marinilabilia rubra]PWD98832.1 GntR family transcriptional regulator [Marinilabilia rubra]